MLQGDESSGGWEGVLGGGREGYMCVCMCACACVRVHVTLLYVFFSKGSARGGVQGEECIKTGNPVVMKYE